MKPLLTFPVDRLRDAPRCRAKAKSTGAACKAPAVRGWAVCRMHGAHGGAPAGPGNGNWRHGERSRESQAMKRELAELIRLAQSTIAATN